MSQIDLKDRCGVITGVPAGLGLGHHAEFAGLGDPWCDRDAAAHAVAYFSGDRATY